MQGIQHQFHKTSLKRGLGGQKGHSRVNHELGVFLDKTFDMNLVQNDVLSMIKLIWMTMYNCLHWLPLIVTQFKSHKQFTHTWYTWDDM